MEWTQQVKQWNCRLSGLPRKGLVILLVIALTAVLFVALPYLWPFALALGCSRLLEPFVRRMAGLLKPLHLGRRTATLLGMLLLFGVAGTLAGLLLGRLSQEFLAMVRTLPQLVVWITGTALPNLRALYDRYLALMPSYVPELLSNAIASLAQRAVGWAASLSGWLTTGAWSTALGIPHVLLALVLVAMGTYYLTADRERIIRFWGRLLPAGLRRQGQRIKEDVLRSIYGQLRSQLLLSLLIMVFLVLLFWVFRVPYGLVAGLGIGLMDAACTGGRAVSGAMEPAFLHWRQHGYRHPHGSCLSGYSDHPSGIGTPHRRPQSGSVSIGDHDGDVRRFPAVRRAGAHWRAGDDGRIAGSAQRMRF